MAWYGSEYGVGGDIAFRFRDGFHKCVVGGFEYKQQVSSLSLGCDLYGVDVALGVLIFDLLYIIDRGC